MWSPELYASHPGSSGGDSRDGVGRGAGDDGGGPVLGAPGAVAGPVAHAHSPSVSKTRGTSKETAMQGRRIAQRRKDRPR